MESCPRLPQGASGTSFSSPRVRHKCGFGTILVDWQWPLWMCYIPRVANAEEQAVVNYMSKLSEELVSYYRMHEVLLKQIGETTAFTSMLPSIINRALAISG